MNKKRILSIIMIMVMVCAMAAAGCGKKEEATEKKEEPKQEETKKEEADKAEPEKAEEPAVTEAKDTNKTKLDDADIEALKASIADSIKKEYLEPNNIAAEDFSWPEVNSHCWIYFNLLREDYISKEFLDINEELVVNEVPGSPEKEIVEATVTGLTNWYEASGVDNYEYFHDATIILTKEEITSIDVAAAK